MQKTICLLPGDGIGPEIVAEAVKVLRAEQGFRHGERVTEFLFHGAKHFHGFGNNLGANACLLYTSLPKQRHGYGHALGYVLQPHTEHQGHGPGNAGFGSA